MLIVAGALFVGFTGSSMPAVVASHFGWSGAANGFMSRAMYVSLMLGVVVVVPSAVALSGWLASVLPPSMLNLPNKAFWLAPERRVATLRSFATWGASFAAVLLLFLCYVHWLVVEANASVPPRLPQGMFMAAFMVFAMAAVAWLVALYRRFGHAP